MTARLGVKSFLVRPEDLYGTIDVDPEGVITRVHPIAPDVIKRHAAVNDRILRVAGIGISNRCDLRSTLSALPSDDQVLLELQPVSPFEARGLPNFSDSAEHAPDVTVDDSQCSVNREAHPGTNDSSESDPEVSQHGGGGGSGDGAERQHDPMELSMSKSGMSPKTSLLSFVATVPDSRAPPATSQTTSAAQGQASGGGGFGGSGRTIKQVLNNALKKCRVGRCVIIVTQDASVNPLGEIEILAKETNAQLSTIDGGKKLKHRLPEAEWSDLIAECLRQGRWLVLLRATKSISLLELLSSMLQECWSRECQGVHPAARVIISTEPHPHFPVALTHGSMPLRIASTFSEAALASHLGETISTSQSCIRALTAQNESLLARPSALIPTVGTDGVPSSPAHPAVAPRPLDSKRRVRISSEVSVVDIEARDIFLTRASATGAAANAPGTAPAQQHVFGSILLKHTFRCLDADKFFCISALAQPNDGASSLAEPRFAIGSSTGFVYIVDRKGSGLLSLHAHEASVWDTSFHTAYSFVTGSEDGTAARWALTNQLAGEAPTPGQDVSAGAQQSTMTSADVVQCGSDVYAVRYNRTGSLFAVGGLSHHIILRQSWEPSVACPLVPVTASVSVGTSIQCLGTFEDHHYVAGGGDGSVSFIDATTYRVATRLTGHTKKVPAIATSDRDRSTLFTGSFDSTVRQWDCRAGSTQHTMKFSTYVTGLAMDNDYLAACVGDSLYLWDVRNLKRILGGCPKAWTGLNRGICIDAGYKLIVTASPDGAGRFWNFA